MRSTGKTTETSTWVHYNKLRFPSLVFCPSNGFDEPEYGMKGPYDDFATKIRSPVPFLPPLVLDQSSNWVNIITHGFS